jgi:hypothetical protein
VRLEARPPHCFSNRFLLRLDGHALGTLESRWFSEGLDVYMPGRRHLRLNKQSWLGSHFVLQDATSGDTLGEADRAGWFTSAWDLDLTAGPARLVRAGWFSPGFEVTQGRETIGHIYPLGPCTRGWEVRTGDGLIQEDLLLVGLVFHVVRRRRARQNQNAGQAGS